jgi:light-regulated signal transduction histidine kinase (bacteriophytochrome)
MTEQLSRTPSSPAFGKADLSNCEREQIHLAGSIQPHGALLVVREDDHIIIQASANAGVFLGLKEGVVGRFLKDLQGDLAERIRPHLKDTLGTLPVAVRCHVGSQLDAFDCLLHRPAGRGLIIELEKAGPAVDPSQHLTKAFERILNSSSLLALCDETTRIFKELIGYDRVMVYRFDKDGHGEIFSEEREAQLESFLGNWYPASDIPQMARRLYERNRVRVLVDVDYEPVPLIPRLAPSTGQELDMSLCFLRSMSPIHIQYLKNMGVGATLVASLMVGGKLWGLISCHHYVPRFIHFETRAMCEVIAEAVSTRIAALESFQQSQAEMSIRRLERRIVEAVSREGDWRMALFDGSQSLLQPVNATGAAVIFEGQVQTVGEVPGTQQLRDIAKWLDGRPRTPVIATSSLGIDVPELAHLSDMAAGVLATPIGNSPGEYIIWFRPERIRTITWGGDPFKPLIVGDNPADLSPRRSFSQWHQLVENTAEAWSSADNASARIIGETITDVVVQMRSVRMLIAQDQLDHVSGQVLSSEHPVIVADQSGKILLANEAFTKLLRRPPHLQWVEDVAQLFTKPAEINRRISDLLEYRRPWRGEAELETGLGAPKTLLVRGDPVMSSPERMLGFVLLFTDLTERQAAESARRRFQEGIIEGRRLVAGRLDSRADLDYQNLVSSVVENAQLAALEITDCLDTGQMPEMLEGVRNSVARAARVLERLLWHSTHQADEPPRAVNDD